MTDLFDVTLDDMIAEVRREIDLRRKVYPRWVDAGRLKLETSELQIQRMEAVLVALETMKDAMEKGEI